MHLLIFNIKYQNLTKCQDVTMPDSFFFVRNISRILLKELIEAL